ncbi:hypothetical protein XENOCAPTIV_018679, partial [Xenoophorus captivus]
VVSLLLCQGADPNARDNWNYTPIHEAAIKGKIDVCIGKPTETDANNCTLQMVLYGSHIMSHYEVIVNMFSKIAFVGVLFCLIAFIDKSGALCEGSKNRKSEAALFNFCTIEAIGFSVMEIHLFISFVNAVHNS